VSAARTVSVNENDTPRQPAHRLRPREPSAFVRTADQIPSRTFQVNICSGSPSPAADATRKSCAVGGCALRAQDAVNAGDGAQNRAVAPVENGEEMNLLGFDLEAALVV
jgi:hypothetical protein